MTLVAALMAAGFCAMLAFPALRHAGRAGSLSFADFALPVAPAVFLLVGLLALNPRAQTGFAFLIYPMLCVVVSLALLYVRVFALSPSKVEPMHLSFWMLVTACVGALVLGAVVPPWYE